jgi:hypothetical protein
MEWATFWAIFGGHWYIWAILGGHWYIWAIFGGHWYILGDWVTFFAYTLSSLVQLRSNSTSFCMKQDDVGGRANFCSELRSESGHFIRFSCRCSNVPNAGINFVKSLILEVPISVCCTSPACISNQTTN